ncbi:hypothetical protein GCM10023093_16400 [Nemorincola caseinilytica]|uniref:Outer membrane protein beta-barrel domain-containing protein n=1 Tax=Nemorincola caseinilytica TaxID=2054315 RepID=A0ABP8NG43_9BACT
MKNILTLGLFMATTFYCHAKDDAPGLRRSLTPYYNGGGGSRVHFFWGMEFGMGRGHSNIKDSIVKGGGFMFRAEIGTKIELPAKYDTRIGLLSISVGGFGAKMAKRQMGFASVPLSYTSLGMGPDGQSRGFYWQAGVNVNYLTSVDGAKKKALDAAYNRVLVDPCVGIGLNAPFRLVAGRGGPEVGSGRVQVGLSFSYGVMNVMKNDASLHYYTLGIRYQYIFM